MIRQVMEWSGNSTKEPSGVGMEWWWGGGSVTYRLLSLRQGPTSWSGLIVFSFRIVILSDCHHHMQSGVQSTIFFVLHADNSNSVKFFDQFYLSTCVYCSLTAGYFHFLSGLSFGMAMTVIHSKVLLYLDCLANSININISQFSMKLCHACFFMTV